jgi:uroporphyrinogen decarboxylase
MLPRDVVIANLEHAQPPRIGLNFSRGRINDLTECGLGPSATHAPKHWARGNVEYYDDEWGNVWHRLREGRSGAEIYEPAIRDWAQLATLRLPDYANRARYEKARQAFAEEPDKYHVGGMPGWVFATSRYLRKMEIYFADLIEYRDEIERLHALVTDQLEQVIRLFAAVGADAVFYCEDLGTQDRVLIGPAMWREVFGPPYRRLTSTAHELGLKVIMHSCGYNWALLDDLAEAGVDCFQFDQPAVYDLPALADKLRRKRVGLLAPLDIQRVLPTGDRALI